MIADVLLNSGATGFWIYWGIFSALMLGAIGLPIPEDLPLLVGGLLVQRGEVRLDLLLAVCYIAILSGDLIIYSIGRFFGPKLLRHRWFARSFHKERLGNVRRQLERRSLLMIFIARHLFYVRTVTFLACGMVRMSLVRFIVADAISALVSVPLMVGIGYLFSENLEAAIASIRRSESAVFTVLALIALLAFCAYLYRRTMKGTGRGDTGSSDLVVASVPQVPQGISKHTLNDGDSPVTSEPAHSTQTGSDPSPENGVVQAGDGSIMFNGRLYKRAPNEIDIVRSKTAKFRSHKTELEEAEDSAAMGRHSGEADGRGNDEWPSERQWATNSINESGEPAGPDGRRASGPVGEPD